MAKKTTQSGITIDDGLDLSKTGQAAADATGAGAPPTTEEELEATETEADENAKAEAEKLNKENEGKVTSTSEAFVNGNVGSSAVDPTKVKTGDRVGGNEAVRAKGVDYGFLGNVNAIGRQIDDGNSVLHAYLQSNRRPEMPEYDDRREKALRWQRGIQLLGQLGGLVGDSQTGGEGGITYKREMGKTADDAIKAEIDKVRNAYIEQANLYTEADKLWRKGAYEAYKADVDRLSKINRTTIPLAADEHMSSSGYIYDTNGRAKGWGGSGRAPIDRRTTLNVLGVPLIFKDKEEKMQAMKSVYKDFLDDTNFQIEVAKEYAKTHTLSSDLTSALMSNDMGKMMYALNDMKKDGEFIKFMNDPGERLLSSWLLKHASMNTIREMMPYTDNFQEQEIADKTLGLVNERVTINSAIDDWARKAWEQSEEGKKAKNKPSDFQKGYDEFLEKTGIPDATERRNMDLLQIKRLYKQLYGKDFDMGEAERRGGKAGESTIFGQEGVGLNKNKLPRWKVNRLERVRPDLVKHIGSKYKDADQDALKEILSEVQGMEEPEMIGYIDDGTLNSVANDLGKTLGYNLDIKYSVLRGNDGTTGFGVTVNGIDYDNLDAKTRQQFDEVNDLIDWSMDGENRAK